MNTANSSLNPAAKQAVQTSLNNMLNSELFRHSERQSRFLEYIVGKSMAGESKQLNQFSIGIDVFDRDASFDPAIDSIVRVEAGRLRAKLREYYASDNIDETVSIDMPKGSYAVAIQINDKNQTKENPPAKGQSHTKTNAKPVIAVMPFTNSSGDPEQEYFADGISEDIITDLSRFPGLSVIARHSSFSFKHKEIEMNEIVRQLGIDYILEGSVRKADNKVRISAQLYNTHDYRQLWAERYDHELDDIFSVQDDVSGKIITALKDNLQGQIHDKDEHNVTRNLEAYDCVLRGAEYARQSNREDRMQAKALFRKAIALDPEYAEAYARLSRLYVYQWIIGDTSNAENVLETAMELATRAVELCPNSAFTHASLGWVHDWCDESDKAHSEWQRAIELNANQTEALNWLALNLAWSGDTTQAKEKIEQALRLNPLDKYNFTQGVIAYMNDDHDSAIVYFEQSLREDANFLPSHLFLASIYVIRGDAKQAKALAKKVLQINPRYSVSVKSKLAIKVPHIGKRFRENLMSLGLAAVN